MHATYVKYFFSMLTILKSSDVFNTCYQIFKFLQSRCLKNSHCFKIAIFPAIFPCADPIFDVCTVHLY